MTSVQPDYFQSTLLLCHHQYFCLVRQLNVLLLKLKMLSLYLPRIKVPQFNCRPLLRIKPWTSQYVRSPRTVEARATASHLPAAAQEPTIDNLPTTAQLPAASNLPAAAQAPVAGNLSVAVQASTVIQSSITTEPLEQPSVSQNCFKSILPLPVRKRMEAAGIHRKPPSSLMTSDEHFEFI